MLDPGDSSPETLPWTRLKIHDDSKNERSKKNIFHLHKRFLFTKNTWL